MKAVRTITFIDRESGDEGVAIIRAETGCLGLALSLAQDGDIEIFLQPKDAGQIIDALKEALQLAQLDT